MTPEMHPIENLPVADPMTLRALPEWLPQATRSYLEHVCTGKPIRAIAREKGCHASTVLRQIRKVESVRDDPLKDEALDALTAQFATAPRKYRTQTEPHSMPPANTRMPDVSDETVDKEARRILRRLCETTAFLLVSPEMDKAAVFRETVPGRRTRTAVMERDVARVFAIRDWIEGEKRGRVAVYQITPAGRAALKRMLAEDKKRKGSKSPFGEQPNAFQEQHREFGERTIIEPDGARKIRYNLAESPLTALARKKNKNGSPYLSCRATGGGRTAA